MDLDNIPVKELLKYSPHYFINKIFGYRVDSVHKKILDHLLDERRSLVLVSRGHGKSKILQGLITWEILHDPNKRIILVSESDGKAQNFLRTIKAVLESSPIIKEFYGDVRGDRWTDHAITIKGRTVIHTEPSLMSVGSGSGSIVGYHSDRIYLDDVVSFHSSRSELQRERDKDWFRTAALPVLMSSGKIGVVGTRYHNKDFYDMLINDLHYDPLILPAIDNDGKALCEWLVPLKDRKNEDGSFQEGLETIRENLGSVIWSLQYLNDATILNDDHIIKYDYIQYYNSIEWKDNKLYVNNKGSSIQVKKIILAVDPAISEKETADYTAICVGGKGQDGNIYILDTSNKHLSFNNLKQEIYRLNDKWEPNQVVVENVAFQAALIQELKRESGLNVVDIKPTRDKTARLQQTSGFFESKKVHFLKDQRDIINQLLEFPDGRNDDLVDSIVYVLHQMRSGGSGMIVMRM